MDLCKVNYQTLLITSLKLTKKDAQNVRENVNLLDLKMIDYITDARNVKKTCTKSKDGLIKKFWRI